MLPQAVTQSIPAHNPWKCYPLVQCPPPQHYVLRRRERCTCSMPFAPSSAELPSWQAERLRQLHSNNKLLQCSFSTQLSHQRCFGFRGLSCNPFLHNETALKLLLLRCKSATYLELLPSTPHDQMPVEKRIAGITPEVPFVPQSWQHARHDSGKKHLPLGHT